MKHNPKVWIPAPPPGAMLALFCLVWFVGLVQVVVFLVMALAA